MKKESVGTFYFLGANQGLIWCHANRGETVSMCHFKEIHFRLKNIILGIGDGDDYAALRGVKTQFNLNSMRGGGTGIYQNAEGDFPAAALRGVKTQLNTDSMHVPQGPSSIQNSQRPTSIAGLTQQQNDGDIKLQLWHKNARGLRDEDRLYELLLKLLLVDWDFVCINETWREAERELFTTFDDHLFAGSGCAGCARGVAFIVNQKWVPFVSSFNRVNERGAYIDITCERLHLRLRIATAYFPHSGYADQHVQTIYTILTGIHEEAKKDHRLFILSRDFNAVTGSRTDGDDWRIIGQHGHGDENPRGQWLKNWASERRLMITNTFFPKRPEQRATYMGPSQIPRQLDYVFVDVVVRTNVIDSCSSYLLDLGSDHNAVRTSWTIPRKQKS